MSRTAINSDHLASSNTPIPTWYEMYLSQPFHLNTVICVGAIEEGREEGNSGGQEGCRTEQGCEGKACENREKVRSAF